MLGNYIRNTTEGDKEGYLLKKNSLGGQHWQRRYFKLRQNILDYYQTPHDVQPSGRLVLDTSSRVEDSTARPCCFIVITSSTSMILSARSYEERKLWKQGIQHAIRNCSHKSSSKRTENCFYVSGNEFQIDRRYKFIKSIGTGAYGIVISAYDTRTGRKCAIKKIPQAFEDHVDAKRIVREIKLLRHFRHENIISLIDLIPPSPSPQQFEDVYMVYELMDTDLHRVIYSQQVLTDEHIQYFLYQTLCGLKYIHSADVLHRDLKPSNLLLNADCDLKICDFGLSRGLSSHDMTINDLTEYVVTRWYRAPEILLSSPNYTSAIDIWSVGCILAEMLGRKPIFPGNDHINQLQIIVETLGSPSEEDMGFISNSKALKFMKGLPKSRKRPFLSLFPDANAKALDLLELMLAFNPEKRISVDDALRHPYVSSLRHGDAQNICPRPFDFGIERGDVSKEALRKHVLDEICHFRPELKCKRLLANHGCHDYLTRRNYRLSSTPMQQKYVAAGTIGVPTPDWT